MPNYMVLLYESRSVWDCMSPNEVQSVIQKYTDWSKRLADQGHYVAGQKLNMSTPGRVLRCNGRKIAVTDGPFAESKEVLAA